MADNGKRDLAALALAAGRTVRDAAAEVRMGERTLHRWLVEDPSFRARVDALRSELFNRAVGRLADQAVAAADRLGSLVGSDREAVALAAAKAVLELGPRLREAAELQQQVDELRQQVEAIRNGDPGTPKAGGETPGRPGPDATDPVLLRDDDSRSE
jgi:hypothetical protein